MTIQELIQKLQEYPADSNLDVRLVGDDTKIILVAEHRELDPIFQFKISEVSRGYGPMGAIERDPGMAGKQMAEHMWPGVPTVVRTKPYG